MDNIQFRQIDSSEIRTLNQVASLFSEMYKYMEDLGLMINLADDGTEKWINSLKKTLNRFSILVVAEDEGQTVGFAVGALSVTPDYLGNRKVGVVTHIFVRPKFREQKIATELLGKLEEWFEERKVHSIELQVLAENDDAIDFWKRMGYENELYQFRKLNR